MDIILTPPLAFLIYVPFLIGLLFFGKGMAGSSKKSIMKETIYASGEEASTNAAAPGYRPFFLIAFFFAILPSWDVNYRIWHVFIPVCTVLAWFDGFSHRLIVRIERKLL